MKAEGDRAPRSPEVSAPEVTHLIRDQLDREEATKTSLETRAGNVISSAGALVTLLFALTALVARPPDFQLPTLARVFIGGALIAFLAAAVLAIIVIRPRAYNAIDVQSLKEMTEDYAWNSPLAIGGPRIANALIVVIDGARRANKLKARYLVSAITSEVVAVIILAMAVGVILIAG